jgi:hypothetical protein
LEKSWRQAASLSVQERQASRQFGSAAERRRMSFVVKKSRNSNVASRIKFVNLVTEGRAAALVALYFWSNLLFILIPRG